VIGVEFRSRGTSAATRKSRLRSRQVSSVINAYLNYIRCFSSIFVDKNSGIILNTLQPFSNLNVFMKSLSSFVKGGILLNRDYVTNDAAAFAKNI